MYACNVWYFRPAGHIVTEYDLSMPDIECERTLKLTSDSKYVRFDVSSEMFAGLFLMRCDFSESQCDSLFTCIHPPVLFLLKKVHISRNRRWTGRCFVRHAERTSIQLVNCYMRMSFDRLRNCQQTTICFLISICLRVFSVLIVSILVASSFGIDSERKYGPEVWF